MAAKAALRGRLKTLLQQEGGLALLESLVVASIPNRGAARPQQSGQAAAPSHSGTRTDVSGSDNSMPAGCCLADVRELMRVRP